MQTASAAPLVETDAEHLQAADQRGAQRGFHAADGAAGEAPVEHSGGDVLNDHHRTDHGVESEFHRTIRRRIGNHIDDVGGDDRDDPHRAGFQNV